MEKRAEEEHVRLQRSEHLGKLVLRQQGTSNATETILQPTQSTPSLVSSKSTHTLREREDLATV